MNKLMNTRFKLLMEDERIQTSLDQVMLDTRLQELLNSNLIEENGLFFLAPLFGDNLIEEDTQSIFLDKTGLECFVNHIHINEYLDSHKKDDSIEMLLQSINYAILLWERLALKGSFKVILSFQCIHGPEAVVRFHKVRSGEDWISTDIEAYDEAILIVQAD